MPRIIENIHAKRKKKKRKRKKGVSDDWLPVTFAL